MSPFAGIAVSAVLYYLSFPNILTTRGYDICAWFFCVPFLMSLEGKSFFIRSVLGFLWGVFTYGLIVQWLVPVSFPGWLMFVGVFSLQGVFFAALCLKDLQRLPLFLFFISSAWVFSEYVHRWILGGFTWSLGYSQTPHAWMLQGACIGGVYAVSWVIVLVNAAVFQLLRQQKTGFRMIQAGALVFFVYVLFGVIRILIPVKGETLRVAAIQPNISREEKQSVWLYDDNMLRHIRLTREAVASGMVDFVVWPETAFADDLLKDDVWRPRMEVLSKELKTPLLLGSALLEDGRDVNAALLLTDRGKWSGRYEKIKLVPFSEAVPSEKVLGRVANRLHLRGYHFRSGTLPSFMTLSSSMRFGVAICSEEFYPQLFREMASNGSGFAVVMLNDGWLTAPEALALHARVSRLRSVETGLPLVRAANTGLTMAFDQYGRSLSSAVLPVQQEGFAVFNVRPVPGGTLYSKLGDIFALLCGCFVIILLVLLKRRGGS